LQGDRSFNARSFTATGCWLLASRNQHFFTQFELYGTKVSRVESRVEKALREGIASSRKPTASSDH